MSSQQGGCKKKKKSEARKARQRMLTATNKDRRAKQRAKKAKKRAGHLTPSDNRNVQFKLAAAEHGLTLKEYRAFLKLNPQEAE